ncbi:MAG: acetylxylan esterase [Kiritimatiellae bacterium]|nr:acetylxylan esterase [Kiritimatiellia bacterium]
MAAGALALVAAAAFAGELDNGFLKGVTDRERPFYAPGETMTFTLRLAGIKAFPPGEWFVKWERTGDDGKRDGGMAPASLTEPLVIKTSLDRPGFVRILAMLVDGQGKVYRKNIPANALTPDGTRPMNHAERHDKRIFFDGGAGVQPEKLKGEREPKDFDEFWAKQRAKLAKVPVRADRKDLTSSEKGHVYAVQIDCAGPRPVTGYLTMPRGVDEGRRFPCRLETHGYSYRPPHNPPGWIRPDEIVLNINAHGMRLPAFGADDVYYRGLGEAIRSNGKAYAFDPVQNSDPEQAYFNGMVLRVMRGLQYLKTLPEWNGKDLYASGGSQGGLQTIWAAGCGEDVTRAESGITWCCDMARNTLRLERKLASDGWYIPWVPALGYYDPVHFAKRIPRTCLTVITRAGLGDYCCPPRGLAILYNSIPGPKKIWWVQGSTHGFVPPPPNQDFWIDDSK